jgi:hypothetical protein
MKTIAHQEYEFETKYLKKSRSGQYYVGVQNGGRRGAHRPQDQVHGDWGFWHEPLTAISASDAEAVADEMGVELGA